MVDDVLSEAKKEKVKMKRIFLAVITALCVIGTGSATTDSNQSVQLKRDIDSVSFIIGSLYGQGLREQTKQFPGSPIQMDALIEGFVRAAKGDSIFLGLDADEAEMFVNNFFQKIQIRMEEESKVEAGKFLSENKGKSGVITTASGLQYKVIKEGTGAKPKAEDMVKIHYHGTFLNGEVFQSTVEQGEPVELPTGDLISGFSEGLQLMAVGSKYIFWIPIELGYYNVPNHPHNNKFLIFEVELLEIVSK